MRLPSSFCRVDARAVAKEKELAAETETKKTYITTEKESEKVHVSEKVDVSELTDVSVKMDTSAEEAKEKQPREDNGVGWYPVPEGAPPMTCACGAGEAHKNYLEEIARQKLTNKEHRIIWKVALQKKMEEDARVQ